MFGDLTDFFSSFINLHFFTLPNCPLRHCKAKKKKTQTQDDYLKQS